MTEPSPEEQLAVITADRDAWCERAAELLTEVNQLRAGTGGAA